MCLAWAFVGVLIALGLRGIGFHIAEGLIYLLSLIVPIVDLVSVGRLSGRRTAV
jgi:hypothetical protein